MTDGDRGLESWSGRQGPELTGDPIWRLLCYREAYLLTLAGEDARLLIRHAACAEVSGQLLRAVGSIAANISEGYGRPTTADRLRFFAYALGSAREARTWYEAARIALGDAALRDRAERLARVRRMTLRLLTRLRSKGARRFDSW